MKEPLADQGNRFKDTDDLNVIQMLAICLRKMDPAKRSPFGITPSALDNLTADHFEKNWESFRKTFYESVKFFTDMKIHGPEMLPYVYLHIILCSYFHENKKADRRLARQWFWRTAFGVDDLRTSSEVYEFCDNFFANAEKGVPISLPPLTISKARLIQASYNYRNALSRAVLAFFASQDPRDFSDPNASVLDNVYLLLSQAPNLHHVYPLNFLKGIKGMPVGSDANSLMNICFLRARTNIQIGDRNPLTYFNEFAKTTPRFDDVLASHCIPGEFIRKPSFAPQDYVDFLKARAALLCAKLKAELPDVQVTITE